jgi:hypothetical protein
VKRCYGLQRAVGLAVGSVAVLASIQMAPMLHAQIDSGTRTPYAGQESASVRGLSEAEISALRTGAGMGLARPGEINGYPGPRHVLELADELALTSDQRAAVQALFDDMQTEAIQLGSQFLAGYQALEQSFRAGTITPEGLQQQSAALGQIEGQLRAAHLKYHLLTTPLLST